MIVSELRYRYIGTDGRWLYGVPKRNLTARDLLIFDIDEEVIKKSGLYQEVKEKQPKIKLNVEFENDGIATAKTKPYKETKKKEGE